MSSHAHHAHHHHPPSLWKVLVLSAGFMIAEILGGIWSGSLALLADSGHMAIDTAALALGLFAQWIARKPPNDQRTYGYYRAEILAASLNGGLLILGSLWILYEAWDRFSHPHSIQGGWMTGIAVGGLLVNLFGLKTVHQHADSNLNVRAVRLHLIFDALGSVGAIIAGALVWGWGLVWADPAVSVLISVLILKGAYDLLMECVDILLESTPKRVNLEALRQDLLAVQGVGEVHDLHVWSIASGVIALSAHVRVKSGHDHAVLLKSCADLLEERHQIHHATLQLEPEAYFHEDNHLDCQKKTK